MSRLTTTCYFYEAKVIFWWKLLMPDIGKMRETGLLIWGTAAVLLAGSATAQQVAEPSQKILFESFLISEGYRSFVDENFNRAEPAFLRAQCPHLAAGLTNGYTPLKEVTFTGTGMNHIISSGAWVSNIEFDRCGTKVKRRMLMNVDGQNKISPIRLLPGDFRGNLILERDAKRIVFPGLMAKANCSDLKALYVRDIVVKSQASAGNWVETWSARVCDKDMTADVSYVTVSDGIMVTADIKN